MIRDFHPCATPFCTRLAYGNHKHCWPCWAKQQHQRESLARRSRGEDEKKRALRAERRKS